MVHKKNACHHLSSYEFPHCITELVYRHGHLLPRESPTPLIPYAAARTRATVESHTQNNQYWFPLSVGELPVISSIHFIVTCLIRIASYITLVLIIFHAICALSSASIFLYIRTSSFQNSHHRPSPFHHIIIMPLLHWLLGHCY